jgi:glycosyltransferase involved in cell wall biosynthesis
MGAGVVKTLYSGVDVERFRPASPLPPTPPVINFIGRTGIEKAPDLILKAALKLATKTRDFAVQILGSNHMARVEMDEYQLQLQELSERLEQMGIVVRRPGHVLRADLPSELQKAHIHVTPSRWDEPFGLVTLEGMACGLATLASHTGGSPEVIGDGGLLFNRDDDADLADKLEPWIRDDILRLKYAAKARAWAEQRTWDRTWSEVCRVVREGR